MIGELTAGRLWHLVNARRIEAGMRHEDLARLWERSNLEVRLWALGRAPCANLLLAAEAWLDALDRAESTEEAR